MRPPAAAARRAGLFWMLGATLAFLAMTAFVKALREGGLSTAEVSFWRSAPCLPPLWLLLWRRGLPFRASRGGWMAARVGFGAAAMAANFGAVRGLTLLQHTVLQLAQPVFVALAAPALLGERLARRTLLALALALLGALAVIRPDLALAGLSTLPRSGWLALGSAACSAVAHLSVRAGTRAGRDPSRTDAPETVVVQFMLWTSLLSAAWLASEGGPRMLGPESATPSMWLEIAAMAGLGLVGQLLMARAYAAADAATVAMVAYAGIPLGLLVDFAAWGELPTAWSLLGAALMVAAGAVLLREPRRP